LIAVDVKSGGAVPTLWGSARPDVLRAAFAQALGTLMRELPEGDMRTIAMAETIGAHERAAERLSNSLQRVR
jgi:hypothetical protein